MIQTPLPMQFGGATQSSPFGVREAIHHAPQPSMRSSHCTHCTGLLTHIAIKASAQVRPAQRTLQFHPYIRHTVHVQEMCGMPGLYSVNFDA